MALGKSDGSVIIDTRVDTKGFGKGINTMQKQVSGLDGALKKLGAVIATTFAVTKLVQFGKEAIDLGSDLQEVQNVVDVTFESMSESVNEFAKGAAEAAGLSETMAKRYVGTFGAMAKAFGFAENESFNMSTALTQLAGDVASFYNISQDQAYTKLKSVFTGETETLKDLGVVMTQNALDSFALAQGLGKTTAKMTEQEKVALRYQFVMKQLSAASGDFERTSGGWANQMRILSLNFDTFKANVGQALINIFTPLLKTINVLVKRLADMSQYFVAFSQLFIGSSETQKGTESLENIEQGYENVADATEQATKAQKGYISGLDELNNYTASSSSEQLGNSVSFDIHLNEADNEFSNLQQKAEKLSEEMENAFEPIKQILTGIQSGEYSLVGEGLSNLVASLTDAFTKAVENVDWDTLGQNSMELFFGIDWVRLATSLTEAGLALDDAIYNFFYGAISSAFSMIAGGDGFKPKDEDLKKLADKYVEWFITSPQSKGFSSQIMPFAFLAESIAVSIAAWEKTESIETALKNFVVHLFSRIAYFWTGKDKDIFAKAISAWWEEDVSPWFSKERWEKMMSGVKEAFKNVFKNAINAAAGIFNNFIDYVNSKMTFSWDAVPLFGIEAGSIQLVNIPKIPMLAKGAVIPPNAPFMAMLGDQRNGTNIEAPADLIRQIVREESASAELLSYLADIARNTRETANKDMSVNIGDRDIARANARGQRAMGYRLVTEG